jgi:hypothetical protein
MAAIDCEHVWIEEYYGHCCCKCKQFIPYGGEPWMPDDEDFFDESDAEDLAVRELLDWQP